MVSFWSCSTFGIRSSGMRSSPILVQVALLLALGIPPALADEPAVAAAAPAPLGAPAALKPLSSGEQLKNLEFRQKLVAGGLTKGPAAAQAVAGAEPLTAQSVRALQTQLEAKDEYIKKLEVRLRATDAQMEARLSALEGSYYAMLPNFTAVYTDWIDPINEGETAWTLVCSMMVLMMTIPGLALFYGGLVRATNVLSTVMQCFSIACLITVEWLAFGYSLCFSTGSPVIGGSGRFWMDGISMRKAHPIRPAIPEPVFAVYMLMFAIITPALISGSFADRMKFGPMLLFMALWHIFCFCPICHSMWMTDGFLYKEGILDFAGGNVVHVAAGMAGLVSAFVVGKRTGFGDQAFPAYNILISGLPPLLIYSELDAAARRKICDSKTRCVAVMGASLLWVGWLGFNGGSVEDHGTAVATMAVLNTQISTATASLSWMFTEWYIRKRPSVLGIISGAIAGMVTITPGAGYVDQTGAFVFGLLAGPVCYFAAQLKTYFNFDDALDAFGIHAPGGVLGGILTGFFATENITGEGSGIKGAFYGNGKQIGLQLYGIVLSSVWSLIVTYTLLKVVDLTIGLRVPVEDELAGLDVVCHGDTIGGSHHSGYAIRSRTPSEGGVSMEDAAQDGPDVSRRSNPETWNTRKASQDANRSDEFDPVA